MGQILKAKARKVDSVLAVLRLQNVSLFKLLYLWNFKKFHHDVGIIYLTLSVISLSRRHLQKIITINGK